MIDLVTHQPLLVVNLHQLMLHNKMISSFQSLEQNIFISSSWYSHLCFTGSDGLYWSWPCLARLTVVQIAHLTWGSNQAVFRVINENKAPQSHPVLKDGCWSEEKAEYLLTATSTSLSFVQCQRLDSDMGQYDKGEAGTESYKMQ